MPNITTQAIVCQLLMYVQANPTASDSAQGIARWWLDTKEGVDVQILGEALNFLIARGVFAERVATDGRLSYRRICSDAQTQELLAAVQPRRDACDDTARGTGT